ncbi:unnamed protein product, partial [Meganyctiphanes norvegica]
MAFSILTKKCISINRKLCICSEATGCPGTVMPQGCPLCMVMGEEPSVDSCLFDQFHLQLSLEPLLICVKGHIVVVGFTSFFIRPRCSLMHTPKFKQSPISIAFMGSNSLMFVEEEKSCQIVLVTDGNAGMGQQSLHKAMMSANNRMASQFPLPFPFPAKLNIVCIANPNEQCLQSSSLLYQRFVDLNGEGDIMIPEGPLSMKSVSSMFETLITTNFNTYSGTLNCGNLSAPITLSPPPQPYCRHHDFEIRRVMPETSIQVLGFLHTGDVSSPPAHSRHLVLPLSAKGDLVMLAKPTEGGGSDDEGASNDEGKVASFCVLLHGGLKVSTIVTIKCQYHGALLEKSNGKQNVTIIYNTNEHSVDVVPWLGKLSNMGPSNKLPGNPYIDSPSPFPVKVHEKKSYALNCVVWVRQGGLQSDIQKILRHARKLPDKTQSFYKELNRLRRAAISYGFPELLEGLANVLERECTLLPSTAHVDAAMQLQHAYEALRNHDKKDIRHNIAPLKTSFSGND